MPKESSVPNESARERVSEYDFAEGAREALSRVLELYEHSDRDLLVVINGSSVNVGKSRLESLLRQRLTEARIFTDTVTTERRSAIERARTDVSDDTLKAMQYHPRRVYFHIRQGLSLRSTEQYRDMLRGNQDMAVPDLIIAIYREDKPFDTKGGLVPVGDIIIRNEFAADKPQ